MYSVVMHYGRVVPLCQEYAKNSYIPLLNSTYQNVAWMRFSALERQTRIAVNCSTLQQIVRGGYRFWQHQIGGAV
jgi:hypothetical protein